MQSLRWMLTKLELVIKLAFTNTRLAIEILLVAALLVAGWMYNKKEKELSNAKTQYGTLAANLQAQIAMRDNTINILQRKPDGTVTHTQIYIPNEGGHIVTHSTQPAEGALIVKPPPGTAIDVGNGVIVYVQYKGFTTKPGFGLDFDGFKMRPYLDVKLAYYKRYSVAVGGSSGGIGITASRHLDDILFFHPQNVEFFVHYRVLRLGNRSEASIGLRSNF